MSSRRVSVLRRVSAAVAGFALAGGAVMVHMGMRDPAAEAAALPLGPQYRERAVQLYREALARDTGSAYRWADLAQALADDRKIPEARLCFDRAVELAPSIPQIWVRHANFCFMQDQPDMALQSAVRVLATVPDYDDLLFGYFDQMIDRPAAVIAAIGGQPRAMQSWLRHLIRTHNTEGAVLAWKRIGQSARPETALAVEYVQYLLQEKQLTVAMNAWADWLGARRGAYPQENLLYNGDFTEAPSGCPLDWTFAPNQYEGPVEVVRESGDVRIHFAGKENLNFDGVSETVVLPHPGAYRLSARIRTDGITTNEGLRVAVPELGLATDSLTETHDWMEVALTFATSQARAIRVAVVRRASEKFDNKIDGTAWISRVRLTPASAPQLRVLE